MNPYQGQYWRDVDPDSTMTKVEHTYWITKQNVLKKIGKKEDECIVASDAELDAKLELFRSIQESCLDLHKIIDRYQDRLCCVAQEENTLGRFLKEAGAGDKTAAGKMMNNVGRAISYGGKQRLGVRPALLRLCQEVETFRARAISDTFANVRTMERQRVEYRAALKWMKDVSQQLDPERQLDKFRKVQGQVRKSKARFDQSKLVCLQKIDLLAAARCNMFSHALVLYHRTMLEFCEKAAHAFLTVANTCKGYQHYEFTIVKELTEPSMRLAEQLNSNSAGDSEEKEQDKDILLFFESEYRDEVPSEDSKETENGGEIPESLPDAPDAQLLDLNLLEIKDNMEDLFASLDQPQGERKDSSLDLAGSMALLDGLFQTEDKSAENWSKEWAEVFGGETSPVKMTPTKSMEGSFCPSLLLDQPPMCTTPLLPPSAGCSRTDQFSPQSNKKGNDKKPKAWLDLFAELDPLGDPDALNQRKVADRNC